MQLCKWNSKVKLYLKLRFIHFLCNWTLYATLGLSSILIFQSGDIFFNRQKSISFSQPHWKFLSSSDRSRNKNEEKYVNAT